MYELLVILSEIIALYNELRGVIGAHDNQFDHFGGLLRCRDVNDIIHADHWH